MKTNAPAPSYKRHRYPAEIIAHTVWLYFRFNLRFRDVEELMAMRGGSLRYETVRRWPLKFGQPYANALRRRRPQPGDTWHIDEIFLTIQGKTAYLWRAVDQQGIVLDILVQSRCGYPAGVKLRPRSSSANCSKAASTCRVSSSPTNWPAMGQPSGSSW